MFRFPLAFALMLAVAVSAGAPARADSRDVAKVIGGLVALYALKELLDEQREARAAPVQRREVARAPRRAPAAAAPRGAPPPSSPRPHRRPETAALPGGDMLLLPDACRVTHRTASGAVDGYGARCMQNAVARPGQLPPDCIRRLDTPDGPEAVYAPRCLRDAGWTSRTALR